MSKMSGSSVSFQSKTFCWQNQGVLVAEYFQTDVISIKSDASLQQAMEVAVNFVGESIPVIDRENNQMLGIVTEADLFKDYLTIQNKIVDLERR